MKKIFAVVVFALVASTASAAMMSSDQWKFEPTIGPMIGIKNMDHRFAMNFKMGKEMIGGQLSMAFLGTPKVLIRPAFTFEYPFYFTFSKSKDFALGPTVDVGPSFGFSGATAISFFDIGFGVRTAYQITNTFGVVAELFHMTMSFARWVSGVGTSSTFALTYDIKLGVFWLF
ncbi:MAG: hypothetical protein V1647_03065 [Pseudomonadota bacterium]